jgi:thymidylate synthase (FAD)
MKAIEPSFEILRCPGGEEVLAFLERCARTCYKSEGKIDTGYEEDVHPVTGDPMSVRVREPSSHRLIRDKILKQGQRRNVFLRLLNKWKRLWEFHKREDHPYDQSDVDEMEQIFNTPDELPHESVIEHASMTVKFVFDRGVSHEMVRHRLASFSQESTRFCNYGKDDFGNEVTFIRPIFWGEDDPLYKLWLKHMQACEDVYLEMLRLGAKPEQARSVLPNSLKTEIIVTANLREWRWIFKQRASLKAHPQMRQVMIPLLKEVKSRIPILFDDIPLLEAA